MGCAIEGCTRPVKARGWCNTHYQRWRLHGDPLGGRWRTYGIKRNVTSSGHVRVWSPGHPTAQKDGYALEHRKVWWDEHGPIPDGFDVHHKNENREDNRLDNLELKAHAEHWRDHLTERGTVTNQYGTFPLRGAL